MRKVLTGKEKKQGGQAWICCSASGRKREGRKRRNSGKPGERRRRQRNKDCTMTV